MRAPIAASASLSEAKNWKAANPPAMIDGCRSRPTASSADDEDDVDDAEQEHHDDHPDLEPGVTSRMMWVLAWLH